MISHSPSSGLREAGFSLLELIAALSILALVATVLYPRLAPSRQNLQLKAFVSEIVADLKQTRAAALTENRDTLLILDTSNRTYGSSNLARKKRFPDGVQLNYTAPASEQVDATRSGYRFRSDGTSSGGTIVVRSRQQSSAISIDWLTGSIDVKGL